ncbi:MipA/OmpV family protein [Lysobacter sp. CA196]|uniref:MipA/OmpV family protein n=1 Tax=Lysobacter sp. CA196 TaxID=3455606 RepID=UPI003F8D5DA5
MTHLGSLIPTTADSNHWPPSGRRRLRTLAAAIAASLLLTLSPAALAMDDDEDDDGGWEFAIGAGVLHQPDYMGSDDYKTDPVPFVYANFGERFYIHGPDFGWNLVEHNGWSLSGVGRYQVSAERKSKDNPALKGLEDIDAGLDLGLGIAYESGAWSAQLHVLKDMSDVYDGRHAELEVGREFQVGSRTRIEVSATAAWADDRYMQTYFGITPAQSASSGLRAHQAGAGLKAVGLGVQVDRYLGEHWMLSGHLELERLLGDARDSPLVKDHGSASQPNLGVFLGYRF